VIGWRVDGLSSDGVADRGDDENTGDDDGGTFHRSISSGSSGAKKIDASRAGS